MMVHDGLDDTQHPIRHTKWHRLLLIPPLMVILLVGGVKVGRIGWYLLSAQRHLRAIEALADQARSGQLRMVDLAALEGKLEGARADLAALQAEAALLLPLCAHLDWLPHVGGDIQAVPYLLEMGLGITRAGELTLKWVPKPGLGQPPLSEGEAPPAEGMLERVTKALVAARPQLLAAQAELDRAFRAREKMDESRLSPRLARLVARGDKYLSLMQSGIQGALLAPELLGASEARSYLILAQNEDELRATGGFISGVGLLRLRDGRILELDFQDSYAVDDLTRPHMSPPGPLRKYMGAEMWLFRDANWSPDFPTAAEVAATIYEQDRGRSVDGVIAADQRAIRYLIEVLGPVQVEGLEGLVTGANFTQAIRRAWAPREGDRSDQWWLHRKDFMSDITAALIRKLQREPDTVDFIGVARALWRASAESHILVYLKDPGAAEILARNRWDGAILPTEGDYLMVVDSNMGFNKVNPNVQQSLDYRLSMEEKHPTALLTITYHNTSDRGGPGQASRSECIQEARYDDTYEGMMHRCYWDYLRVYVPRGVLLLEATPNPLPPGSLYYRMSGAGVDGLDTGEPSVGAGEGGKDVLGTFFALAPQESRQIHFTYELPPSVVQETEDPSMGQTMYRYSLLIQKQPGTLALPVHVTVRLPSEARLISAHPAPDLIEDGPLQGNLLHYWLELWTTKQLEVLFR